MAIDECDLCRGTGEVFCGTCDELAAVRIKAGFRCLPCGAYEAMKANPRPVAMAGAVVARAAQAVRQ